MYTSKHIKTHTQVNVKLHTYMYTSKHINNQHLALNTHTPIHTYMNIRLTCIYTMIKKIYIYSYCFKHTHIYIQMNHINENTYKHVQA